jgi:hypothetical protein
VQAYEASFLEQAQHISSGLLHERQEAVKGLEAAAVQLGFIPAGEGGGGAGRVCWGAGGGGRVQVLWVQSGSQTSR